MYDYNGLRASQINSVFPGCIPCRCYDDDEKIYKVPRYDVRVRFGTTHYGTRGKIIKEIVVACDCCGAERRYDVEYCGVCENDLSW